VNLQEFSQIFAMLAVQLGDTQADEIKIRAFHKALEDLDVELVAMAAQRLGRSALNAEGEAWMPKAPEWRAMAGKIEHERKQENDRRIRKRLLAGLQPLCSECGDTGWRTLVDGERFAPCPCRKLRRLEVLGVRPMPELPEAIPAVNNEPKLLEAVKGAVKGF
jgi:ribosomal protein L12E/L44/L45/RPP1/RPP2